MAFREPDLELVAVLASQILLALENGRLTRQMVAAQSLASIGLVAASVAHEINNPLAYALANLAYVEGELARLGELADLFDGAAGPAAVRAGWERVGGRARLAGLAEAAGEAAEGMGRIRDLALDLRSLARTSEAAADEPVDLNHVVRSSLRVASAQIRGHAVLVERLGPEVLVRGSPARLSQVLINLLVNAGQACAAGTAMRREITVTTRRQGDLVVAEVADTGPGIRPEHLPRLFEPFFTTKAPGLGTGLGLSISRDIVRRCGGDIRVASTLGAGTTITVELPVADAAGRESDAAAVGAGPPAAGRRPPIPPAGADAPARRCRVLIVDDEPGIVRALQRVLAPHHDVVLARSGEEALRALAEPERFDLVLCDVLMPGIHGPEVYRRAVAGRAQLADAFVFMTGSAGLRELEPALSVGGPRVLRKPLDLAALQQLLARRAGQPAPA